MQKIKKPVLPMQNKTNALPMQKMIYKKIGISEAQKDLKTQKLCQFYRKSAIGDLTPLPLKMQNPAKSNCP